MSNSPWIKNHVDECMLYDKCVMRIVSIYTCTIFNFSTACLHKSCICICCINHRLDTYRPFTDNACTCSKLMLVVRGYMDSMDIHGYSATTNKCTFCTFLMQVYVLSATDMSATTFATMRIIKSWHFTPANLCFTLMTMWEVSKYNSLWFNHHFWSLKSWVFKGGFENQSG